MREVVRYTYRLRPGALAECALMAEWPRCRYRWNEAVHQRRIGRKPTLAKVGKLLTAAHTARTWAKRVVERTFSCRSCGCTGGRDENVARTILAVAERRGTSVDDVRHALASSMVVAGAVRSELEIPRL